MTPFIGVGTGCPSRGRGAAFHPRRQSLAENDRLAERGAGLARMGQHRIAQLLVTLLESVGVDVASSRRPWLDQRVFFSPRARARSMLRG